MNSPPSNFKTLIDQARAGSDSAVWTLLDQFMPYIQRSLARMTDSVRGKTDPDDILQSAWKSVLRNPAGLANITTPEQFVAYLVGAAKNKALETRRRYTRAQAADVRREQPLDSLGEPGPRSGQSLIDKNARTGSSIIACRERWDLALKAVGQRGATIVKLRLQGLTQAEIATQLGVHQVTVRRDLKDMLDAVTT